MLILISLITKGVAVQRRKISYSACILLELVRIDDITIYGRIKLLIQY